MYEYIHLNSLQQTFIFLRADAPDEDDALLLRRIMFILDET